MDPRILSFRSRLLRPARLLLALLALGVLLGAIAPSFGSAQAPEPEPPRPDPNARELPELRTANARTFENPDGSRMVELSMGPVNYRDPDGAWRPIDPTLVADGEAGYAFRNAADSTTAQLPARLDGAPVRLSTGDSWLEFSLQGAGPSAPEPTATGVRYLGALPGVDVRYDSLPGALKEELVLAGPRSPRVFRYDIKLSPGLSGQADADGSVEFRDADRVLRFAFARPYLKDAGQGPASVSDQVAVELVRVPRGYTLTYRADDAWLEAPERRYPVVLDPTAQYQAYIPANVVSGGLVDRDTYIADGPYATTALAFGAAVYAGDFGSFRTRALMRFDLALPGTTGGVIPQEAEILDAWMLARPTATSGGAPAVEVRALNEAWDQQASWNNASTGTPWSVAGGGTPDAPVDTNHGNLRPSGVQFPGWYEWSIAPLVRQWVAGSRVNNGVVLRTVGEPANQWVALASINSADSTTWPRLYVSYRPTAIGASSTGQFVSAGLNDRMAARVNVASGNLMVQATDLAIAGTGLDLDVTRTYNSGSIDQSANFGKNWSLNGSLDVTLVVFPSGAATFFGPSGEAANFRRLANGSYQRPPELDATLVVNGSGIHTLTFNDTGEVFRFQGSTLTSHEDRHGNDITYAAPAGSLTGITDTQNRTVTPTHDTANRIATLTDAGGRQVQYRYDTNGRLDRFTDAAGNHTHYGYAGATNELDTITDPRGNEARITYTTTATGARKVASLSRVLNPTGPVLATTTFSYSSTVTTCPAATLPDAKSIGTTTVTDPTGNATVYCWDADRRVTRVSDAALTSSTTWTGTDLPDTITSPGGTTINTYDTATGLLLEQTTDPTGATTKFEYGSTSAPHDPTKVTDPQGVVTHYAYDAAGNLCLVRHDRAPQGANLCADTTGPFAHLTYNANGTPASATDANGSTTTYGYDAQGRLTTITPPSPLGTESRTYDALSRLATVTDGKNQTTTFTVDAFDRITLVTHQDGSQVSNSYDANGNRLTQADGAGTTNYSFDRLNRLTSEAPPTGPQVTYGYDLTNNLTSVTDGGGTVTYQYAGTAGRLSSVTQPDSSQIVFGYDSDGNRNQVSHPNGVVQTTVFDGGGKKASVIATKGGTTLSSFAYNYVDSLSLHTEAVQTETEMNGAITSYTYASPGRLVRAQTKNSGGTVTADYQYSYDAAGNRTSQDVNGAQTNYSYNGANQLTQAGSTTYTYDANGNLTGSSGGFGAAYNAKDQTTSVTPAGGSAVAMAYRGAGQADRTQTGLISMGLSRLGVASTSDLAGSQYYTRTPEGDLLAQRSASGTLYYLADARGSITGLTDGAGVLVATYRYDPFGETTASTGAVSNRWRFAGQFFDADTGLYKIGARYYDAAVGRWTQQDPILALSDVRQSNPYLYVGGDPINFFDPTGLKTVRDQGCVAKLKKAGRIVPQTACWVNNNIGPGPIAKAIVKTATVVAKSAAATYRGVGPYVAGCVILGTYGAVQQSSRLPSSPQAAGLRAAGGFLLGCGGAVIAVATGP